MRKLIVNAFVREVILYDDGILITYTFTDNLEHLKKTKETTLKTEKQIEQTEKSASSYSVSSSIFSRFSQHLTYPHILIYENSVRIGFVLPTDFNSFLPK